MTDEDIKALASEAASKAVWQTFRMFGVDTEDQDSVNEFRHDLVFARELRRTTKGVQSKVLMVVIGILVAGGIAAMLKGFGLNPK